MQTDGNAKQAAHGANAVLNERFLFCSQESGRILQVAAEMGHVGRDFVWILCKTAFGKKMGVFPSSFYPGLLGEWRPLRGRAPRPSTVDWRANNYYDDVLKLIDCFRCSILPEVGVLDLPLTGRREPSSGGRTLLSLVVRPPLEVKKSFGLD